jgi:hypothetical protein
MVLVANPSDEYIPGVYNSLEQQQHDQREVAVANMKRYVDPRTGTISYSGADFSAVVHLPVSQEQLEAEIRSLQTDAKLIRDRIQRSQDVWELYNTTIRDELTDWQYAWEQYQYYLGEGADPVQAAFWYDEYKASKTREREAIHARNLAGGGPGYREGLERQSEVFEEEIKRLEGLRKDLRSYVKPVKLFDVQTITISSHREKFPVRTLGRVHPKSYTRGPRTLAGSMIFTLFNKHALWDLVQAGSGFYSSGVGISGTDSGYPELNTVLVDQLPPFDITLIASNELGDTSYAVLYGVEIVNDGRTISIQDIITESVMQFVCRDFEDLRPLLNRRGSLAKGIEGKTRTASEVANERRTELERRRVRLNPFV